MSVITYDEEYNGKRARVELDIIQAEGMGSITRTLLLLEGGEPPPLNADRRTWALYTLRSRTFPDLIGSLRGGFVEIDGKKYDAVELPFSIFEQMPFPLIVLWEQETYRCNPFWIPIAETTQKKASGNGSRASRRSTTRKLQATKTASPNSSI
jgi:hypothetical protein